MKDAEYLKYRHMNQNNDTHNDEVDKNLIGLVTNGNKEALNTLLMRHKDWIYNVAIRMTGNTNDAEDVTQEILLKIVTKLSSFQGKSTFRTWLYRITLNHVMTMKRNVKENLFSSFEKHKNILDSLPDSDLDGEFVIQKNMLVEETKAECMLGMLLCLSREQRIVFILGGILGMISSQGAELLEITEANFRKRLARARSELKNFIEKNCSLIDKNNTCTCARKTKSAIDMGIIDPKKLQYSEDHIKQVKDVISQSKITVMDMVELRHQEIFKESPYKVFDQRSFNELMGTVTKPN